MTNMTNMNVYGLKVESGRWNRAKALVPKYPLP
jgi:hypothetical protein